MALARSASGPGGLSINTSSANSLFGSNSTTATPASMFGATTTSKPAGGLFASPATTTAAAPAGGLFGAVATTAAPSGGLFGAAAPTAVPQSGGLFGTLNASTQPQSATQFSSTTASTAAGGAAAQTGGLFGTATSQPQSAGLFGRVGASQPPQTGGLFGTATATQPGPTSAQPAQLGGFGSLNNQTPNKPASTLFGSVGQAQQQPTQLGGGLFPSSNPGTFNMNQSSNQQPHTVPGVRIDMANIRGTTRFSDLHDELQSQITSFDNIIQAQIQLKNECDAIMPSHDAQLSCIPSDVDFIRRKMIGVENALESDAEAIAQVREVLKLDIENARLSFRAIENLKLPAQYHNTGLWPTNPGAPQDSNNGQAQDIVDFYSRTTDDMSATFTRYTKNISEIEQHLRNVEVSSVQQINNLVARRNGGNSNQEDPTQELAEALREFEQSLLLVAGKVGGVREGMQRLQLTSFENGVNGNNVNGWSTGEKRNGIY